IEKMTILVTFFLSCSVFIGMIGASEKFHDCDVYSDEANIPTENTYCIKDFEDGKFYCKSWTCADPDCPEEQQLAQEGSSCPICPDTCTNGGIIFDKGDSIKCVDGSNKCTCTDTGVVISTRRGTNKFWLCGVPEN
uniref:Uncharacterized protein n=3 Tax=Magallana gigas TaxID=29159 RepID=A0A8W8L0W4_MAGGI